MLLAAGLVLGAALSPVLASQGKRGFTASTSDWTSNGPFGGAARQVVIDPVDSSRLYAVLGRRSGQYKVYRSADGATTWNNISSSLEPLNDRPVLVIDPVTPSTLYLGTGTGVYKSLNRGDTWSQASSGLPNGSAIAVLAVASSSPQTLFAVVLGQGVYKSSNGGGSWSAAGTGLGSKTVSDLKVDPGSASIVYAVADDQVFKSSNGAASWQEFSVGLPFFVRWLAIDPSNPALLYAASEFKGIYRSTNGGASWSVLENGPPGGIHSFVKVDPSDSSILYAGYFVDRPLYRSLDAGASWSVVSGDPFAAVAWDLAIDPGDSDRLYLASFELGLARSLDGGDSWQHSSDGLSSTDVQRVLADPVTSGIFYVATFTGVYKSSDGAASWQLAIDGMESFETFDLAHSASAPNQLLATTRERQLDLRMYRSTDGANTWSNAGAGITDSEVLSLIIDDDNPNLAYAGGLSRVFRSIDGGISWSPTGNDITGGRIDNLLMDRSTPGHLYAATSISGGIFETVNNGNTWTRADSGVTGSPRWLALSEPSPSHMYAVTMVSSSQTTGFQSDDGAASWSTVDPLPGNPSLRILVPDPVRSMVVYAGTGPGVANQPNARVLVSFDRTASWYPLGSTMAGASSVRTLTVDPADPQRLLAGTDAGVYELSSPLLFADGVESGSLVAWEASKP